MVFLKHASTLVLAVWIMKIKGTSTIGKNTNNYTFIRCYQYSGFLFECICPRNNTAWKMDDYNDEYILVCNSIGQVSFMKLFGDGFLYRSKRRKRSIDESRITRSTNEYKIKCFINKHKTWHCKCPESNVVLNLKNDRELFIVCGADKSMLLMKSVSIRAKQTFAEKYEEEQEEARPNVFHELKEGLPEKKQYPYENNFEHSSGLNNDNTSKTENRTRNINEKEDKNNTQNNKQMQDAVNKPLTTIKPRNTAKIATTEKKAGTTVKPTTKDSVPGQKQKVLYPLTTKAEVVKNVSVTPYKRVGVTSTQPKTTVGKQPTTTKITTLKRPTTTTTVKQPTTTVKQTTTIVQQTTTTVKQPTTTVKQTIKPFTNVTKGINRKTAGQQKVIHKPPISSVSQHDSSGKWRTAPYACNFLGKKLRLKEFMKYGNCNYICIDFGQVIRRC